MWYPNPKYKPAACFLKGTLIILSDGTKMPIEEIKIGNKVLSSEGVNEVKKVFHNDYEGLIYSINNSAFFCYR